MLLMATSTFSIKKNNCVVFLLVVIHELDMLNELRASLVSATDKHLEVPRVTPDH